MAQIARNGQVDLSLAATQSLVVGSFGAGQTRIYTAAPTAPAVAGQLPLVYVLFAVVTGGATYLTFAAATNVRVEASSGCDVEYDFGAQPALTATPFAATTSLTAKAGGGQAGATALTGNVNRLTVCATAADSALLPLGVVGRRVSVYNAGAASANVFPQTGESINSGAANAAFAVANTKAAIFECVATGVWNAVLSA
jgi:hypothetical protein